MVKLSKTYLVPVKGTHCQWTDVCVGARALEYALQSARRSGYLVGTVTSRPTRTI